HRPCPGRGHQSAERRAHRPGGDSPVKTIEMSEATAPLAEFAGRARTEPILVTSGGKPIAALVPLENADLETVTLSTNEKFLALIERSRVAQTTQGGISAAEMRRRLRL